MADELRQHMTALMDRHLAEAFGVPLELLQNCVRATAPEIQAGVDMAYGTDQTSYAVRSGGLWSNNLNPSQKSALTAEELLRQIQTITQAINAGGIPYAASLAPLSPAQLWRQEFMKQFGALPKDGRTPFNDFWCYYHMSPYLNGMGGLTENDWPWQELLTRLLALPHFLQVVENFESGNLKARDPGLRSNVSRRMAIAMAVQRSIRRTHLAMCCVLGDDVMAEILLDEKNPLRGRYAIDKIKVLSGLPFKPE